MSDSEHEAEDARSEEQKDEAELAKEIEDKCFEAFNAFDKEGSGTIASTDVKGVFDMQGIPITEDDIYRLLSDIDPDNTGVVHYAEFKSRVLTKELARLVTQDETELLDAYVAMGGDADGGGCVDATKLIDTIKNQFQMTIDIEKLIEEIDEDGSGEIEFDEFKELLTGAES